MTISPAPVPETNVAEPPVVLTGDLFDDLVGNTGFPSANLLPNIIKVRREVAHAKKRALLMVLAVLGLMVAMIGLTSVQQRSADAAKAQAQAQLDAALAQKQRYSYVPAVYLAVSNARAELANAMGQEVQVSRLMEGLASLQPADVSLLTWTATVGPATDSELQADQDVLPGVGAVTITGEARSMEGIAVWLDRIRANPDYASPVLNQVGSTAEGIYTFDASAELTDQALSGRFVEADK